MNSTANRLNRKRQYSKKMIREAFSALLKTTPFERITIQAICDTADINRSTFYANYVDLYALRQELCDEYLSLLVPLIENYGDVADDRSFYKKMYMMVKDNEWLVRTVYLLNDMTVQEKALEAVYRNIVMPRTRNLSEKEKKQLEVMFDFSFAGGLYVTNKWLMDGIAMSADEFADCISTLSTRCLGVPDANGEYQKLPF